MPRLSLGNKLLLAFLLILMPMLALIIYSYQQECERTASNTLDDQLRTSRAIGALVDASIEDAFSIAWAFSKDVTLRTMDPGKIDPYLESLSPRFPQLDDVAIFDTEGNNVGSARVRVPPGQPRPSVADRQYFQIAKATRRPTISNVLISRATGNPIVVAAVPIIDEPASLIGVVIASLNMDYLAKRVATVGLRKSQSIFLVDPEGTVAFDTAMSPNQWGQISYADFPPVRAAQSGKASVERSIVTPTGDISMVAATRTPMYSGIVGVSVRESEVLGPIQDSLIRQLVFFLSVLFFTSLLAVLLSRSMIVRPLEVLRDQITAFGRGQMTCRADLRTGDELEQLADAFNSMAGDIQRRQEEREKFVHTVSHDLRAPLTIIQGQAQFVQRSLERAGISGPVMVGVGAILTSAQRMNAMIQDLVDSVRIEAGPLRLEKTPVDLRSFVSDLLERARTMMDVARVRTEIPEDLPRVSADPNRLERVMVNLLTNALKYSSPESEVTVRAERRDNEVVVAIVDRGVGIAPEDLPHIFERFYEPKAGRRAEGLGLGLYITRMFVEAQGGRVWVESELGKGSTFYFALPTA